MTGKRVPRRILSSVLSINYRMINFLYTVMLLIVRDRFRGHICKIKFAEISRTCLNKYFGVKIISIDQFVCK